MTTRTSLEAIRRATLAAFPPLSAEAQRLGLALYHALTTTGPVRREELAAAVDVATREVIAILDQPGMRCQVQYDDDKHIVGFAGLSTAPTPHRVTLNGHRRFTWCAWDALFIPDLVGESRALVESVCPATDKSIRLTVAGGRVSASGRYPVMSFVLPDVDGCAASTERSIACFCDDIRFLSSYEVGVEWIAHRAGMFLLSLPDAFTLGGQYTAARFPDATIARRNSTGASSPSLTPDDSANGAWKC